MPSTPFFLPANSGNRFCLLHSPIQTARGAILYIAPWGEEANKSRRLSALQAQAFADAGYAVLRMDLFGCGDSSGDFAQAHWQTWLDDLNLARAWLTREVNAPLWLWGVRSGCLLARDFAATLEQTANLLFWQPVLSGNAMLQQFLRLELAARTLEGDTSATTISASALLKAGKNVEIAGYTLSAELAAELEHTTLQAFSPRGNASKLVWIEVTSRTPASLSPANSNAIKAWQEAGFTVSQEALHGPAFWQSYEITELPALTALTLEKVTTA